MKLNTLRSIYFLVVLISIASCSQKQDQQAVLSKEPIQVPTVDIADLPPPIKAKYLDPASLAPPEVIPLKYEPTVSPAHPNIHPVGTPTVIQVPKDLEIIVLGEDVPMPETIPARGKETPVFQAKPIPALSSRMRDDAVFNIQHLSADEGLPFGGLSMMEDSKGNIWIGGGRSVVRYDGENFFPYTEQEGIFGGFVTLEDSKGNIWFGGPNSGFGYYDGNKVIDFRVQDEIKDAWGNSVFEDSKGNVWWGTTKGVFKYDGQYFNFFKKENGIAISSDLMGHWLDSRVNAILEDSRGHIWWATSGSGVLRYDGKRIIRYTEKEGLVDNYIKCILEDREGKIWFGSGGEGVAKGKGISIYNPDITTDGGLGGTFSNYSTNQGLSGSRITAMAEDQSGKIWLSTFDGGLTCYTGQSFIHYTEEEGLAINSINSMIIDSKENIWLGLNNNNGVHRMKINSFRHFTENQGLHNSAARVAEDRKGNIWIAGCYVGLTKYDGINFTNYSQEEEVIRDCPVPMLEDNQGNFWVGTRDEGIAQFDGRVFKRFGKEQGFINPFYFNVTTHLDRKGQIWFSSFSNPDELDGMAIRYNPENGQVTHFSDGRKESIGGASFYEDKQHDLWLGGSGCIAKYDPINDQLNYVVQLKTAPGPNWVHILMDDEKGNLWFSIEADPRVYSIKKNGDNSTILAYSKDQGFPEFIKEVVIDDDDNVWITRSDKVMVFLDGAENMDSPDKTWTEYTIGDGLKARSYTDLTATIDSKGRYWVPSIDAGVAVLDLNTFRLPEEAPVNLGISHLDMKQQFIDYGRLSDSIYRTTLSFGGPLHASFDSVAAFQNYPTELSLPYDLNHLTFHFTATDWSSPHQVKYSYKIDGVDSDWSLPDTEAKVDYRNLSHGIHTFQLKAIGEANVWSEPFEYTFTIRPPWWHTWWAYCLYALLVVGAIGGYVIRLRQKVKEKQEQLEREQYLNRELRELNIATTRFVPKDFVQILDKDALKELKLGDQTQATMTVLFADIRDYTSLSEHMTPEENFKFINAYLGHMGPIIQAHGGFICQYYGDGIMALFKDNHHHAVQAAIDMQHELQRYNRERFAHNRKPIEVGIGLNTGQLMLGVIGDEQRYDTSVISDAVNTASRMEGLTKIFGCKVIVSEKTLQQLKIYPKEKDSDTLGGDYRFLGKVKVKGKDRVLKIYDFYDGETEEVRDLKSNTKELFEKALQLYYDREFGKAADVLKVIIEKFPGDIATNYYMDKCVQYIIDGVDERWSGVEMMVSK